MHNNINVLDASELYTYKGLHPIFFTNLTTYKGKEYEKEYIYIHTHIWTEETGRLWPRGPQRVGLKRGHMCVCTYIYLNHFSVYLKLTQHCKSTILRISKIKQNIEGGLISVTYINQNFTKTTLDNPKLN